MAAETKPSFWRSAKARAIGVLATGSAAVGTVVQTVAAEPINLTPVADLLTEVGGLVPSIVALVIAILPALIIFAVVGFVVMFFQTIIDALGSVSRLIR